MPGAILHEFVLIAWTAVLRAGPQHLRAPRALLAVAFLVYWLVEVALLRHTSDGSTAALGALVALRLGIVAAFVWGWVALAGHPRRFAATLAALLVLGAVAQAAKLPLLPIAAHTPRSWLEAALVVVVMQVASWTLPTTAVRVATGQHIPVRHATANAGWDGAPPAG